MAQALHLANGSTLNDKLRADSNVVARSIQQKRPDDLIVEEAFLAALSRRPSERERAAYLQALRAAVATPAPAAESKPGSAAAQPRRQAIEDVYWALLTSDEFLFNH